MSLKVNKMKNKIAAYGKEYINNFKQNPLSATAVLIMQIIFILGWGTFYTFLCERYIRYIIPGRTYTKTAIYPETFSLTVIAFIFSFFIYKSFRTLFLNNNTLKPKVIILALSLLCAILAYPLQLLLNEAVFFLPQTSVAFWADWQIYNAFNLVNMLQRNRSFNFWLTGVKFRYISWTDLRNCFFYPEREQNQNTACQTLLRINKMKNKIAAYGKEYISNFKQNPLSATAVLIMQIIFVLGWGVFFLYLLRLYLSFVIPGITDPKGNIYADTLYAILLTAVYPYCCYKFGKMLFSSHTSLKLKVWAIFCSLICAFLLFPAYSGVQRLPFFRSGTYTSFWAQ